MTEVDFDPYSQWLNIVEPQRPPTAYQLLGLAPLESDLGRIQAGFQKQELALSRIADQADPELFANLQRDLDEALRLLSDPERKALLDAKIRRRLTTRVEQATSAQPGAGGAIVCEACQRENPVARRYCTGCGKSLWQSCPRCKAECAAAERFCGACGADVVVAWAERERDCQLRLDEARRLAEAHHFEAAVRSLRTVATASEARLERFAAQALEEIERVEQARDSARGSAGFGLEQARQLIAKAAYEQALDVLSSVPEPLRGEEHASLLERARNCRQEILSLSGEIREAVAHKLIADLGPKLERLLCLVPTHAQARQLAEQLREHHIRLAKARLKQFKYQEALDHLLRIPAVVIDKTVETLRDTAAELAALTHEVREGALADRNHLALAERLCRFAPQDPAATKLREQMQQKAKSPPADTRFGAPNLAAPPKRTFLGAPINWLTNIEHASCTDAAAKHTLQAHPGEFFVALGLALQGLGMAAVDCDLTPKATTNGLISSLTSLTAGRRSSALAWGVDLSEYSLKAIQLQAGADSVSIKAAHWIAVEQPLSRADVATQAENVQSALASFLKLAGDLKGSKVCVDLPNQRVLGRFFELPPVPAKRVGEALQYEAQHQMPIPLDELCWSYSILDSRPGKANDQPRRVLLQAARNTHVRERIGRFKEAGVPVDIVQSNALALHNALRFERLVAPADSKSDDQAPGAIAAIDVGAEATNVVVSSTRGAWFRTFGHGGDVFARELQRQLLLTNEQSELSLREPARAKRFSRWIEVLQPLYVQFGSEVIRSLATYNKLWSDEPVRQIYGLGGAIAAVGLLRYLRTGR